MRIQRKFKNFVNESINNENNSLLYYLFDWDDNILYMSTVIHLEHRIDDIWTSIDISTEEFTDVRHFIKDYYNGIDSDWRYVKDDPNLTYSDFRDFGPHGDKIFLSDTKKAIRDNNYGPIWFDFLKCLVTGSLFSIITARGHEPETIKNCIKWIINDCLTNDQKELMINNLKKFNDLFNTKYNNDLTNEEILDNYLDLCDFIGVSSKWFAKTFNINTGNSASPEAYKNMAARYFINKINKYGKKINKNIKIGFSDDDLSTAKSMYNFFNNKLSLDFPLIDFHTYHTFKDGKHKIR